MHDERMRVSAIAVPAEEDLRPDALTFVVPLHSTLMKLGEHVVDRRSWASVPAGSRSTIRAMSHASRVLFLSVHDGLRDAFIAQYSPLDVHRENFTRYFSSVQVLPRTVWVHEICHRYMFERVAMQWHDNDATRFLETEIVKEAYFLCRDREAGTERDVLVQAYTPVITKALAAIEANLFEPRLMERLARDVGASESTLLRSFKKELGTTPAAYWRARRLDEALGLLRAGRMSVAEVAMYVGYDNAAAFAHAFQARFGQVPSSFVLRGGRREAP